MMGYKVLAHKGPYIMMAIPLQISQDFVNQAYWSLVLCISVELRRFVAVRLCYTHCVRLIPFQFVTSHPHERA